METDQVNNNFEKRFQMLDLLSDNEETLDEWTTAYTQLLNDIKALPGARYGLAVRLKIAQIKQAVYLCTLYQQHKASEGMN